VKRGRPECKPFLADLVDEAAALFGTKTHQPIEFFGRSSTTPTPSKSLHARYNKALGAALTSSLLLLIPSETSVLLPLYLPNIDHQLN
jgi:hypothetical protein